MPPAATVKGDRLLSTEPLPIDLLQQWNGSLNVKVGEIVGPGVKVTSAGLSVGLSGGRLTARPSGTIGAGSAGSGEACRTAIISASWALITASGRW